MSKRYFKVDTGSGYIVNVTVGPTSAPGYEAVPQTVDLIHVSVGWSLIDGEYVDTRTAYRNRQNN